MAVAARFSQSFQQKEAKKGTSRKASPSFLTLHLRGVINDDEIEDPIAVLEKLSKKDSKDDTSDMWKLTSHGFWLHIRLIATKDCLFLLLRNNDDDSAYEVVDSIPLHEIQGLGNITDEDLNKILESCQTTAIPWQTTRDRVPIANVSDDLIKPQDIKLEANNQTIECKPLSCDHESRMSSSILQLRTQKGGFNQGREFLFYTGAEHLRDSWSSELQLLSDIAKQAYKRRHAIECFQQEARKIYDSTPFRFSMFLAIAVNFVISMMQAEIGDGANLCSPNNQTSTASQYTQDVYNNLDMAFTFLFLAELLFNFAAHAFWPFWRDKWNWFDTVVVLASLCLLFASTANNALIKQLRVLRVFRVIRAFRRIKEMREMVNGIVASLAAGGEALVIGLLVVAIYANIGRQFFASEAPESFCDFFHSFYTMFGVVAYHKFPDAVKIFDDDGYVIVGSAVFIYSFVAFVLLLFLQIVVAVLLDSFYKAMHTMKEEEEKSNSNQRGLTSNGSALNQVLSELAAFDTQDNLVGRVDEIFDAFDFNRSGGLSYAEISEGLYKFKSIRLQIEDFHKLTDSGKLCNEEQELDRANFVKVMLKELQDFVLRSIAEAQSDEDVPADIFALLNLVKILMVELELVQRDIAQAQKAIAEVRDDIRREVGRQSDLMQAQAQQLQEVYSLVTA